MTPEQMQQLRAAFAAEQIGKLPKPTKRDNAKGRCSECGGWHGLPAVHLDYVGHAAVTDRLLQVDPDWTWWPMALDERGGPVFDAKGGLWIMLKILDVQRPGYGDGDSTKEVIGDAIRNAAMRFGVALDLWAKEPLTLEQDGDTAPARKPAARAARKASPTPAAAALSNQQKRIVIAAKEAGLDDELRHRITRMLTGHTSAKDVPDEKCEQVAQNIAWFADHVELALRELEAWEQKNGFTVAV